MPAASPYDEIPFDNHPFVQTHPSRLATVATLFGLNPTPIDKCRVLELGCAVGGNIIPLAELYPESEFVGVDLSARQIADGERVIRAVGLKNITLRHASILDVDASYGTFDYIICHGVFSWVPDPVQQKILAIYAANMNPNGVGYVSYNTYPGWHMRGMIRDMLRYHCGRFETPTAKVEQARALLDFLRQSANDERDPFVTLLRQELDGLRDQSASYLYHEYLEGVNKPLYFHQFIEMAHKHNVRYLGEARLSTMVMMNCSTAVQKAISAVAKDQIQTEQYLDFVRNRPFRETLLVHPTVNPNWSMHPEVIRKLHITLPKKPSDDRVDVKSNTVAATYTTALGMTVTTTSPILKAAMQVLGQKWPGTMSFAELDKSVQELLELKSHDGQQLAVALLNAYLMSNLTEFHSAPIPHVRATERPVALSVARATLKEGLSGVTTRRHEFFRTNEIDKEIILMLDGTHDRSAIIDKLVRLSVAGELHVHKAGQRLLDPTALRATLSRAVENALERYANTCSLKE
ncbi:MAG: class I SAM-dependent methyltransferase [Planctomycetes bacterium]|nr:class I SAM-dependent methyltransferase [Planctomycetota bacterium]